MTTPICEYSLIIVYILIGKLGSLILVTNCQRSLDKQIRTSLDKKNDENCKKCSWMKIERACGDSSLLIATDIINNKFTYHFRRSS